jgi:cysteine desulfurase
LKGKEAMENAPQPFIYLDHNATTPLDPAVVDAMMGVIKGEFGNPSSSYPLGQKAKDLTEDSRKEVALLLGCESDEVIFTSGGSESNNMVLKGIIDFSRPQENHIITCAVEHPAILNPCLYLLELGVQITILPVDGSGLVDPDDVRKAIRPETTLVSLMLANNETGTLLPIKEISTITREARVPFHTDAAQAVGKIPVSVDDLGVDFLSVAGHKLYGPKGIGALYVREGKPLTPLIHGGGQEGGRRSGTENTILGVGLGTACRVARLAVSEDYQNMKKMRDRLQALLFDRIEGLVLNGHPLQRLPNTLNISVPKLEGAKILEGLPELAASTGAACHDRSVKLSHVLAAMSVPPEIGMGALRFTVGRSNSPEQIEEAAGLIVAQVQKMRGNRG